MTNTFELLWGFILTMPLGLKLIYIGLVVGLVWYICLTISRKRDPRFTWYDTKIKAINDALAEARRVKDPAERAEAITAAFRKMRRELHYEIGADFTDYTTGQRSVMICLLTRYRDHMYFLKNTKR